ncbi:hypothetical protein BDV96DRAFT_494415 [Lophiotrema nucula]|uniref:U4/U6 snRNA-associated-splicing factor PRP24 n=1 Tax=Lophiotrema nucula TaxID=690887 RepID=A0A6A5Z4V9_9PLEO|nr:hypothetical protein BDV96DRAFT_494415 [Lophiotrema nucula]
MDINSLLSPQESPSAETPPPPPALASPSLRSPSKRPSLRHMPSRTSSGLSQQITSSPQYFHDQLPTPGHAVYQQHTTPPARSPGFTSFPNGRTIHSAASTPPIDARQPLGSPHDARMTPPHPLSRQASTPGMDTLADLAAMQQRQEAARQNAAVYQAQRPSISLQNIPRTISGTPSDISMAEPSPKPPRVFVSKALDAENIATLNQLEAALKDNPFDYYSHVSFVHILHTGLQTHMYSQDGSYQDARSYELLPILREAYETMDAKYALGEQLWEYRLNDEKTLARNVEERLAVLELYNKATQEEPYSAKLWVAYGDYVSFLISCIWGPNPPEQWTAEDREIGKEVFNTELLLDVLQRGADSVKNNVSDSSLVWDRYLQVLQEDLEQHYNFDKVMRVLNIFDRRLEQPHASWDNTFSAYSQFISRYHANEYDKIMQGTLARTTKVKQMYGAREEQEFNLLKAVQQNDKEAEYSYTTRYLKWEKKTMGPFSFPLVNALYERATLRFPVNPEIWEDHIEFLIWQSNRDVPLLSVLERATRHCPWSGALWSHRILTMEAENKSFNEIERVKHSASETGLLEHSDLEELIKVQIAWCGYLRRKAFDDAGAMEDDADIAEVGIRSALELVNETGIKKYAEKWTGDPKYRLERIHIKFWTQRADLKEARRIWNDLVPHQQDSYDFWYRYYIWEMVVWSNNAVRDRSNAGQHLKTPTLATLVLEQGIKRLTTLDFPEPLVEMYVNHCEQHESVLKVRSAIIERRRAERIISHRRQAEYEQAQQAEPVAAQEASSSGKRKLDAVTEEDRVAKKNKQTDDVPAPVRGVSEAPSETHSVQLKRDRENSSIIVRNLPKDTTQMRVRQFFSDAGEVRSVTLKQDGVSDLTTTATVEFSSPEEAEYSRVKEAKSFDGVDIQITRAGNTTLYVTNYPPQADDAYIRNLFSPFGKILELRFPSLKFDTHRRFCYVQFSNPDEARAATKLDNTEVDGGLKLIAKISDPNAKQKRQGATAEGREVYLWRLAFTIKRKELQEIFSKFGKIQHIKLPTIPNGRNKGFGYITYERKEDAEAAVAEMNGKDLWGLDVHAEIASDRPTVKQPKIKSTLESTASPEAWDHTPGADQHTEGEAKSAAPAPVRERSLALLDLPDTVNDARVSELLKPFGYKKITLMPQHGGAIIELDTVEAVGKASLALDGYEISADRKIRVGTPQELKASRGEFKPNNSFIQPARVNRPVARGGLRGRGKPGLGARAGTPRTAASSSNAGEKPAAKSNDDFRAMLLAGKKSAEPEPAVSNGDGEKEMKDAES